MATAKANTKTPPQTQMSVDVDAEPWTITEQDNDPSIVSLSSANVSVDAVPGRRNPGAVRRPPQQQTKASDKKQGSPTEKAAMQPLKGSRDDDIACQVEQVSKRIEDLTMSTSEDSSSLDSSYSSYNSFDPESEKKKSLKSLDEEIQEYWKEFPPDLKAPFIDVLVLYSVEDRPEAEKFRLHLVNDIKMPGGEKMRALLYDCPEFTSLSGSQFQHLDLAVERSTYVFVYLTKSFVECKWCEISSESCLMKAIYDEEKRWCVVPVYTQKRTSCNFKIPMGLNSLKGINYYNNDEFYRNGVARLVGDKITVKYRMTEALKIRQKEWIEKFKREQEQLKNEQLKKKHVEEQITRLVRENLMAERKQWPEGILPSSWSDSELSSMPHSGSTNSLKDMKEQNPYVAAYLEQYRNLPYPQQSAQTGQYPLSQPGNVPNVGDAAMYSNNPHAVRRSQSQASAISKDAAASLSQVPAEILQKIQGLSYEEQQKYKNMYQEESLKHMQQQIREMQSLQMQQQAIMNIPHYQPPQNQLFDLHQQQQQTAMFHQRISGLHGSMSGHPSSDQSLSQQLTNAPNLSMGSLSNQVQPGSFVSSVGQQQVAMATTQQSQIPNMAALSFNSYHPSSVPGMLGQTSQGEFCSSQESYTTRGSSQDHSTGQSMDGPNSSYRGGNIPNSGLFNSVSTNLESNVEEDSGSFQGPPATKSRMNSGRGENKVNIEDHSSRDSIEDIKGKTEKMETKGKKQKHVYYTINVYNAGNVQVGDSNIVQEGRSEGQEGSDDDEDDSADSGPEESAVTEEKRLNQRMKMPMSRMEGCPSEMQAPSNPESAAIADAPPSTHSPSVRNPFIPQPGTINFNNNSNTYPLKSSDGTKPIGTVTPVKQEIPPAKDDKDETRQKTVVPSPQTARKTVHTGPVQGTETDVDNINSTPTPVQLLKKAETRPMENRSDSPPVNAVGPCQRNLNAESQNRPAQSVNPTSNRVNFTMNATQLFYTQQRMQPQYQRRMQTQDVELGEDPLSQSRDNVLGESEGFTPNTTEPDGDYDMCTNVDYEGGELLEPVNEPANRNPSSNGPRAILGSIISRLSNKVK